MSVQQQQDERPFQAMQLAATLPDDVASFLADLSDAELAAVADMTAAVHAAATTTQASRRFTELWMSAVAKPATSTTEVVWPSRTSQLLGELVASVKAPQPAPVPAPTQAPGFAPAGRPVPGNAPLPVPGMPGEVFAGALTAGAGDVPPEVAAAATQVIPAVVVPAAIGPAAAAPAPQQPTVAALPPAPVAIPAPSPVPRQPAPTITAQPTTSSEDGQ